MELYSIHLVLVEQLLLSPKLRMEKGFITYGEACKKLDCMVIYIRF